MFETTSFLTDPENIDMDALEKEVRRMRAEAFASVVSAPFRAMRRLARIRPQRLKAPSGV